MSDSPPHSDVEEETRFGSEEVEEELVLEEATGYSGDEFDEDDSDRPVTRGRSSSPARHSSPRRLSASPHRLSASPRRFSASPRRHSAARTSSEEEDAMARQSPFVPEDSDSPPSTSSSGARATARGSRAPPLYVATINVSQPPSERRAPPAYSRLSRRSGDEDGKGSKASLNSSLDSADESTAFLGARRLSHNSEEVSVANVELQEMAGGASGEDTVPKPPSYSEAVSRVETGVARQVETNFGPEVTTRYSRTMDDDEDEADRRGELPAGRDEPPPGYVDIDAPAERVGFSRDESGSGSIDVEANERAESTASSDYPEGVLANIWACLKCRRSTIRRTIIITSVFISCLLLFVILFPFQFIYVEYHQFALVRTKSTGVVHTDRVYQHGCYVLGADREFVYLDRTIQTIDFPNLGMFTRDIVDVSIDVKLYYNVDFDGVAQLWRDYAGDHDHVITATAKTTIRNCAPRVSQDEYLQQRDYVQDLLHTAINEKFADWGITIPYLEYLNLHLPSRVLDKKLKLLLLKTDIEKEKAYQLQRKIELETELIVTPILYLAKEAINNGTVEAAAIKTVSKTEKSRVIDVTHAKVMASMMETLNVNQTDHALSFYYLATLNTIDHYAGAVEYTKRGLYMPNSN